MNWRKIYFSIFICLFGEIFNCCALVQHIHVDEHFHIHERKQNIQKFDKNKTIKDDAEKAIKMERKIHYHDVDTFVTTSIPNIKTTDYDVSDANEVAVSESTNISSEKELNKQGYFKLPKCIRLRFRDSGPETVRQHAAKSIDLDCRVRGASCRKHLSVNWLKDGMSIQNYFGR